MTLTGIPDSVRAELAALYEDEKARALEEIAAGRAGDDRQRIGRAAHRLRPSAMQMDDHALAAILDDLERWARSDAPWDEAEASLDALDLTGRL